MNVCVFCGSSSGTNPVYQEAAKKFARSLLDNHCTLVYGGGNIGLMGILADEVLSGGGTVIGVIPEFLMQREVGHIGLSQLILVNSMHERKKKMADLSDVFVALPGGWGTLDELAEILTWRQLGIIPNSIGLLNINGFFTPLIAQMERMVAEGFLANEHFDTFIVEDIPQKLLSRLGIPSV